MTRILVLYYSLHGHVARMAQAAAEGVRDGCRQPADLRRVPETMSADARRRAHAVDDATPVAQVDDLPGYDAILFGTPTRYGNMCGQMRTFLDQTGALWQRGALIGKLGSVFTSTGTQHGGQETTILSFYPTLLHLGMVLVGLPYSCTEQVGLDEIKGGSPYGAATISGHDDSREPSRQELAMARFQGRHVAQLAQRLRAGDSA